MKTQILLNQKTKEILCIAQGKGPIHDFRLFKESIGQAIHRKINLLADSGYQEIQKLHAKSRIPKKSSKKCPLTKTEKRESVWYYPL
ncbi:transposase [Bacillus cereus]|uniref:transposase n=1 Tax=Bacillus cereus TaxID=1396 RepID=UPI00311A2078